MLCDIERLNNGEVDLRTATLFFYLPQLLFLIINVTDFALLPLTRKSFWPLLLGSFTKTLSALNNYFTNIALSDLVIAFFYKKLVSHQLHKLSQLE